MDSTPNEIVLRIFSFLSYWDLKLRVPLTCKRFRALVSKPSEIGDVDKRLFRDRVVAGSLIDGIDVEVHPVFEILSYDCAGTIDEILLHRGMKLVDCDVAKENAVSPAVSEMSLWIGDHAGWSSRVFLRSSDGTSAITVYDIMKRVVDYIYGKIPKGQYMNPGRDSAWIERELSGEEARLVREGRTRDEVQKITEEHGRKWTGVTKVKFEDGEAQLWVVETNPMDLGAMFASIIAGLRQGQQ